MLEHRGGSTEERTDSGTGSAWLLLQAVHKTGLCEKAGFLKVVGGGGTEGLQQSTQVLLGGQLPGMVLPVSQQLRANLLLSMWLSL